jgi:hypothetical protein
VDVEDTMMMIMIMMMVVSFHCCHTKYTTFLMLRFWLRLRLREFSQTSDSRSDGGSSGSGQSVGTSSNRLATSLAIPNTGGGSFDGFLTAESTIVSSMLLLFKLSADSSKR